MCAGVYTLRWVKIWYKIGFNMMKCCIYLSLTTQWANLNQKMSFRNLQGGVICSLKLKKTSCYNVISKRVTYFISHYGWRIKMYLTVVAHQDNMSTQRGKYQQTLIETANLAKSGLIFAIGADTYVSHMIRFHWIIFPVQRNYIPLIFLRYKGMVEVSIWSLRP